MEWIDLFVIGFGVAILYFIPKGISMLSKWNSGASYFYLRWGICFLGSGIFLSAYLLGASIISYARIFLR